jgi:hypothetical protein
MLAAVDIPDHMLAALLCSLSVFCILYLGIRPCMFSYDKYRGADKSLAQPGRKRTKATEDLDFHISYL